MTYKVERVLKVTVVRVKTLCALCVCRMYVIAQECRKLWDWTRVKAGWVTLRFCRTCGVHVSDGIVGMLCVSGVYALIE